MTILISVKINDGIIIASDSTTSFFRNDEKFVQSYDNANKIFNLYRGLPIGAATCGAGNIGNASISTISKDLRDRFQSKTADNADGGLNPQSYTMENVAKAAHEFLLKAVNEAGEPVWLTYWVFGYSSGRAFPELWSILIQGTNFPDPLLVAGETAWGPNWAGEQEALDRLILGRPHVVIESAVKNGMDHDKASELLGKMAGDLYETLVLPAMPIQDAIELARYLVDVTAGFMRFSIVRARTVGGPVEIAAITKHEGFKWVARKHFYAPSLNPLALDHT